jgi:hypothetical protein
MLPSSRPMISGPLAPFAEGLLRALLDSGYSALSSRNLLLLTAHLSRWMDE